MTKKRLFSILALLLFSTLATTHLAARAQNQPEVHVTAKLIADTTAVQPGKPFKLGVELFMEPGWHTYYKVSGDAGLPTTIIWTLPAGFKAGELLWQKPSKFKEEEIVTYGYQNKTLIAAQITPPKNVDLTKPLKFAAKVKWLSCKEICLPGGTTVDLSLPVSQDGSASRADHQDLFSTVGFTGDVKELKEASSASESKESTKAAEASRAGAKPLPANSSGTAPPAGSSSLSGSPGGSAEASILNQSFQIEGSAKEKQSLLAYLGMAFVGGLILNVMPCVLPVIAIKVLSFVEQAHDEPKRVQLLGLTFAAGIVSSFMLLAVIVIAIKATGQSIGWGFQFKSPAVVIAMAALVLIFALSLFGLFYVSLDAGAIDKLASREGFAGTFFKGVLATVLSTPCTAPFLGSALGFAFVNPAPVVASIFFTSAIGMSAPYIVLTAKPEWMRFMPKPGLWMEKFKESLGFVLLATVVWLLKILGDEAGSTAMVDTGFFLVALAFSAWIVSKYTDLTSTGNRKITVWCIAAAVSGLAFYKLVWPLPGVGTPLTATHKSDRTETGDHGSAAGAIAWQPFTFERLDRELAAGKTVLLDFTADWCLTCKVNEHAVLESKPVEERLKALNVVTLQADWTLQDDHITKLLQKFGRSGVPLYVIFPGSRPTQPIVLPEVITQGLVVKALDDAGASK